MPIALRRGVTLAATLLAVALVVAALALRPHPAGAQVDTGDVILSASVVVTPDVNGYAVLAGGSQDIGLQAVVCSGSNPQGGTNQIPAQVMCQLRATDTLIRVKNHVGTSVTAPVRIVVFGDFGPELPPTAANAFRHLHQIG